MKIGDFSRLSRVPIKTLRYYDEIGLLVPSQVDTFTSYRHYSFEQLPRLNRILALKDLGLSLEQIKQVLNDGLTMEQLVGMLRLKKVEIQQRMQEETERLERVESRLRQIERENKMPEYEVVLKKVEAMPVASLRNVIPDYPEQGHLWQELETYLQACKQVPVGPCFTIYHSDEPEIDAEVCEPLKETFKAKGNVKSYLLPGVELVASTIHHGPFVTIGQAYEAILHWIEANGYSIQGPCREIYLQSSNNGSQTDPNTVTEIQFPVTNS